MLEQLDCKERYGVEINEHARNMAKKRGILCVERIDEVPTDTIDIVISNHCLEHCTNPYEILVDLKRVLRKDGKVIFVVPNENSRKVNVKGDKDMHLYTWTPQNLANLFIVAGYKVVKAEIIVSKWPKQYVMIQKIVGWKLFHLLCRVWCMLRRNGYQTRVIAVLEDR